MEIGFSLIVLVVVLTIAFLATLFLLLYWVIRLAIRHERGRLHHIGGSFGENSE
jgi:hypothetical protein